MTCATQWWRAGGVARRLKRSPPRGSPGGWGVLSLFLLRHGETEFSRGDRFCGEIDAPLTEAGARMGELFADAYGALPWRAIVTSTRRRTIGTAAPLAARAAVPIPRDARLDELSFGGWPGPQKRDAAPQPHARFPPRRGQPHP